MSSVTFGRFYDLLREVKTSGEQPDDGMAGQEGPLLDSGEDSRAMEAIRTGMHLRKADCGDFWDDFITVSGDAEGMAELLDVPRDKVTAWAGRIHELLDQVKQKDNTESDGEGNASLEPTGDGEGASADPLGNNGPHQPDLKPTPS